MAIFKQKRKIVKHGKLIWCCSLLPEVTLLHFLPPLVSLQYILRVIFTSFPEFSVVISERTGPKGANLCAQKSDLSILISEEQHSV